MLNVSACCFDHLDNDNHELMWFTLFVIHFTVTLIPLNSEMLFLVHGLS